MGWFQITNVLGEREQEGAVRVEGGAALVKVFRGDPSGGAFHLRAR